MSKRVLIISDSVFRQTGYSTVTKSILDNIDPSFKIAQLGVSHFPVDYQATNINIDYYSPIMKHENDGCGYNGLAIEHYNSDTKTVEQFQPTVNLDPITGLICKNGMGNPQDAYNFDSAFYVIEHFKPDIVIAINDIWGMYKLAFLKNRSKFKLISYLAVDSECFPVVIKNQEEINTMQFIENVDKLIVFTKWAKRTINTTAQIALGRKFDNIEVIEHGVDLTKFNNLDSRDDIIDQIFKLDPKKVFLIGSVNRNQPRKRLDAIFQILSILKTKYERNGRKFMVHFHCAIDDHHGWDLRWLAAFYNVQDRIILDENLKPGLGVPDELLNTIMNAYDVHLVPTNSEGWGLSILETMACGIPNVISDYSAHGDWAKDAAIKIKLVAKIHEPITNHIKGIIDINHAAKQISLLYNSTKMHNDYVKKSIKLANKLQWKNICVKWNELLNNLDMENLEVDRYETTLLNMNNILEFPENPLITDFEVMEV